MNGESACVAERMTQRFHSECIAVRRVGGGVRAGEKSNQVWHAGRDAGATEEIVCTSRYLPCICYGQRYPFLHVFPQDHIYGDRTRGDSVPLRLQKVAL